MKENDAFIELVCVSPEQLPAPVLPEVAVIGRSNVGKSTLLNALTGKKGMLRVSQTPGRTEGVIFVRLGKRGYLVDLPGYGFAKVPLPVKASWKRLVESYLARPARGGAVLLVDIRRDAEEGERQIVEWFRRSGRPLRVVLTKADKLSRGRWKGRATKLAAELGLGPEEFPLPLSAATGEGLRRLRAMVEEILES